MLHSIVYDVYICASADQVKCSWRGGGGDSLRGHLGGLLVAIGTAAAS